MNIASEIAKIRAYALSAKTCIYNEDAFTAIELAGATACKVNECVDAINSIIAIVEEVEKLAGLDYDAETETVTI